MLQQKIVRTPQNFPDLSCGNQGIGCTDLQLVCQDGTVCSHQFLLSMHSDLLKSLFGEQMIPANDAEWMPGDSGMGVKPFIKQTYRKQHVILLLLPEYQCREVEILLQLLCRGETSKMNRSLDVYKDGKYKIFHLLKDLGINDVRGGFNKTMLEKVELPQVTEGKEPAVSGSLVNIRNTISSPQNAASSVSQHPQMFGSLICQHPQSVASIQKAVSSVSHRAQNAASSVSHRPQNAESSVSHHPQISASSVSHYPQNADSVSHRFQNAGSAVSHHHQSAVSSVSHYPQIAANSVSHRFQNASRAVSDRPQDAAGSVSLYPQNAVSSGSHRPQNATSSISCLDINSSPQNCDGSGSGSSPAPLDVSGGNGINSAQKTCINSGPLLDTLAAAPLNPETPRRGSLENNVPGATLVKEPVGPPGTGSTPPPPLQRDHNNCPVILETPVVQTQDCDLPSKEASVNVTQSCLHSVRDTVPEKQPALHTGTAEDLHPPSSDDVHIIKDTHQEKLVKLTNTTSLVEDTSLRDVDALTSEGDTVSQKKDTLSQVDDVHILEPTDHILEDCHPEKIDTPQPIKITIKLTNPASLKASHSVVDNSLWEVEAVHSERDEVTQSTDASTDEVHILEDISQTNSDTVESLQSTTPSGNNASQKLEDTKHGGPDGSLLSVENTINQNQDTLLSLQKTDPPISDEVHILKDTHPSKQDALQSLVYASPARNPDPVEDNALSHEQDVNSDTCSTVVDEQEDMDDIDEDVQDATDDNVEDVQDARDTTSFLADDDSHIVQDVDTSTEDIMFLDENTNFLEDATQTEEASSKEDLRDQSSRGLQQNFLNETPTQESSHSDPHGSSEEISPPTGSRSRRSRSKSVTDPRSDTPPKSVTDPYKNVVRGFSKRKAYSQTIPVEPYNPTNDDKLKQECMNSTRKLVVQLKNLTNSNTDFNKWFKEDPQLMGNKIDDKSSAEMISEDEKNDEPLSPTSKTLTRDQNSSPLNKIRDHDRLKDDNAEATDIEEEDIHMSYSLTNAGFDELEMTDIKNTGEHEKSPPAKRNQNPKKRQRTISGKGPKSKKHKVESNTQQIEQSLKCPLENCNYEETPETTYHSMEYFVVKHFISTHITALYKDIERQKMYQCEESGCPYQHKSKTSFLAHRALEHLDLVRRVETSRKTCTDEESVVYDGMQVQLLTLWNEWEQQLAKECEENGNNDKDVEKASEFIGISVLEPELHEDADKLNNKNQRKKKSTTPNKDCVIAKLFKKEGKPSGISGLSGVGKVVESGEERLTPNKDSGKLVKREKKGSDTTGTGKAEDSGERDTLCKTNEVAKTTKRLPYSRGHEKMTKKANNESEYSRIFGEPAQLVPKTTTKLKKNIVSSSPENNKDSQLKTLSAEISSVEASVEDSNYKCKSCPYIYETDQDLIDHVVKLHSDEYEKIPQLECGEKYYECTEQCPRKVKNKDYVQHMYKDHAKIDNNWVDSGKCDELLQCSEPCPRTFKTKDSKSRYSQHLFRDHEKLTLLFIQDSKNWSPEGPLSKLKFCKVVEKVAAGESYEENQVSGILNQSLKKKSGRTSIFRTTPPEKLKPNKDSLFQPIPKCSQIIQNRPAPVVTKPPVDNNPESDDEVHIIENDEDNDTKLRPSSSTSATFATEKRKRMQKMKSKESTKVVPEKKTTKTIVEITVSDSDDETASEKVPGVESVDTNSCQFCESPFDSDDRAASMHIFEYHLQEMDEMWKDLFVHEKEGYCCKLCEKKELMPSVKRMKRHIFNDHSIEFLNKASPIGNFSNKTSELLKTKIPAELFSRSEELEETESNTAKHVEKIHKCVSDNSGIQGNDWLEMGYNDPDENADKCADEERVCENNENDQCNQVSNSKQVYPDVPKEVNISNTPEDEHSDQESNNLNQEEESPKDCMLENEKFANTNKDLNLEDGEIEVENVEKRITRSSAERDESQSINTNLNEKNRNLLSPVSSDDGLHSEFVHCASSFTSEDCKFRTNKAKELINHMIEERGPLEKIRRERKEEIPCPACRHHFTNWKQLEDHVREIHTREDKTGRNPSSIKEERRSRDGERKSKDKEKPGDFLRNPRDADEDAQIRKMLKESQKEDKSFRDNHNAAMREQHVMSEDRKTGGQDMMNDEQYYKAEERRGMEARRRSRTESNQQRRPNWGQPRNENSNWDDNNSPIDNQNHNLSRFQYGEQFNRQQNNESHPGPSGQHFPSNRGHHQRQWGKQGKRFNDYGGDQWTGRTHSSHINRPRGNAGKRSFDQRPPPRCSSTDSGKVKNPRRNSDEDYDRRHGSGGRRSSFSSPGSYLFCSGCHSTFTEIAKLEEHTRICRSTRN